MFIKLIIYLRILAVDKIQFTEFNQFNKLIEFDRFDGLLDEFDE